MKAVVYRKYGSPDVLQLEEVAKPIPKGNKVLIKIFATSVSSGDVRMRSFNIPPLPWIPMRLAIGLTKPRKKILGMAVAGEIETVGKDVTEFRTGDKVFGSTEFAMGAHAEYVCMPEKGVLITKSHDMSYEESAALPFGGFTALHFLRKGDIQSGQKVLIYGASGALGTYAVQLAKHFGAHVTGVCGTSNLDLVISLGADKVIDYTKADVAASMETYDIIFDTIGKSPFSDCIHALTKNGCYLRAVHMTLKPILRGLWTSLTSSKKVIGGVTATKVEDLIFLKELVETRKIKPVIDRCFPLEQTAEAHRYVDQGHKKGNVVITVRQDRPR
jgi:NADPH:quinone reductase-like Zn-dependent oxidoreductase